MVYKKGTSVHHTQYLGNILQKTTAQPRDIWLKHLKNASFFLAFSPREWGKSRVLLVRVPEKAVSTVGLLKNHKNSPPGLMILHNFLKNA